MATLDIVGSAAVDVVPIIPNFHEKLKALVLPVADKVGEEAGKRMGQAISDNIVIAIPEAINKGGKAAQKAATKQGSDTGGAFARSIRMKLEAAFKAMPKIQVGADTSEVDSDLQAIRARIESLSGKNVGIDVSVGEASAEIDRLDEELKQLGHEHPNPSVRIDTATARAALADIRAQLDSLPDRRAISLEVDGAFGAKMRAAIAEAQASLPEINVDADTTPARAEIQEIRAQLAALADARIGIDIDAATAIAKITDMQERLRRLGATSPDIDVRVDTADAAAKLATIKALAEATRTKTVIDVDTSAATSAVKNLAIQVAGLAAIPIGAALTAGIGGLLAMITAAGAGIGALGLAAIPAIKNVAAALQAKTAATADSDKATANSGATDAQAAQRALSLASAQDALATAHRNAARQIAQANEAVSNAERQLAQAVQSASDQQQQSAEQVAKAEQQAADTRRQAAQQVKQAEQALTSAQRDAKTAEDALTEARKTAAEQLKDLNDQLADGALDQRDAILQVQQAQQDLNATMRDPKASAIQRAQAQLTYDQAVQHAKEQKQSYADLQKSAAAQQKAGVDGSDAVKQAAQQLADAQSNVRDQTQAVADAQRQAAEQEANAAQSVADARRQAARQEQQSAQQVADAQRGVTDAVQAAADAQVDAAQSVTSAERGLESARLSGATALGKVSSAQETYRKALAKLTPAERELYDTIAGPHGLKAAFNDWAHALEPDVLPIFTRGVSTAIHTLPSLTPLVKGAADAIGTLQDKASDNVKKPFWQGFKKDIAQNVKPAIVGLGTSLGNVLAGMAGIVDAFLPHMDGIVKESDKVTGRFARWGESLKGSPKFEKFLGYVNDKAPGAAHFIGQILSAALAFVKAIGPATDVTEAVVGPLLDGIAWLATNAPEVVLTLWGLYAASKAIAIGMVAFNAALAVARVILPLVTGEMTLLDIALDANVIGVIVLAIAALVLGLIEAYKHIGWFRTAVDTTFGAIGTSLSWLWTTILQPVFSAIQTAAQLTGAVAVWLWDKAIGPAFRAIGKAAQLMATITMTLLFLPLYLMIKDVVGPIVGWLWTHVVKPYFGKIGDQATWLWKNAIKPAFGFINDMFHDVGDMASWLWTHAVKPAFKAIGDQASWLWKNGVKPAFDLLMKGVEKVANSFGLGKDTIKAAWSQVEGIAKKPIKFVIDQVYNKGIVPLWHDVAKITGAKDLDKISLKGWARGGILPGWSTHQQGDDQLTPMRRGEGVAVSEAMRDPYERARLLAVNKAALRGESLAPFRGYAGGGIVGWFRDKASDVGSFIKDAADVVSNPKKAFAALIKSATDKMAPLLTSPWAKNAAKIPGKILHGLETKVENIFTGGGGGGKIPTGQHKAVILQALSAAHVPPPGTLAQWLSGLNTLITRESGWNASAINLTDSNAKAGIPSQGLAQTIPPTFAHYVPKSLAARGILDPVANVAAAIRYIVATYGNISNVQQANASLPPKGYALGGFPDVGPMSLVGEHGPELVRFLSPAQVSSHGDTRAIFESLASVGAAQNTPTQLSADVHVYVGDREITDIVRTEVTLHEQDTARAIPTRRTR